MVSSQQIQDPLERCLFESFRDSFCVMVDENKPSFGAVLLQLDQNVILDIGTLATSSSLYHLMTSSSERKIKSFISFNIISLSESLTLLNSNHPVYFSPSHEINSSI